MAIVCLLYSDLDKGRPSVFFQARLFEPVLLLRPDEQKAVRSSRRVWRLWVSIFEANLIHRVVVIDDEYFHIVHGGTRGEYIGHFVSASEALIISVMSM